MRRLFAYALIAAACIYSIAGVTRAQDRDCKSEQRLRNDIAFVLRGAGDNERAQLTILNRLANPVERAKLEATFEPGLAQALERIDRDLKC